MRQRLTLFTGLILALPNVGHAQETRASVEVDATGGYSNNPFAQNDDRTGSAFVAVDVSPQVKLLTQRSTFTLSGQAHVQEYTSRYPVTDSYRVSLDYRGRPSAALTTFAHIDLSSAVLGGDDQYAVGRIAGRGSTTGLTTIGTTAGGTAAGTTPTVTSEPLDTSAGPIISDIGLLGTRDRRRSLYATAGGSDALSARDTLSLSGFADIARYGQFGDLSDYNGYGGTLGYMRQVSARLNAGVQGGVSRYDYRGARGGTSVYSLEATASGRLSQYWSLNGALGASFIGSDVVGSGKSTSLSGSFTLCRKDIKNDLCLQAARQARATGINGAQYVTSAGLDWRHRLSERSNLSLDGTYLKEGGLTNLSGLQNQYLRTSATYDHQLRERLRVLVSARYRRIFGGSAGEPSDFGGQVGLSYLFGDRR